MYLIINDVVYTWWIEHCAGLMSLLVKPMDNYESSGTSHVDKMVVVAYGNNMAASLQMNGIVEKLHLITI